MIGTFAAVLVFTMLKEGYEDIQRYRADKELNNKKTLRFEEGTATLKEIYWKDVKIGDILKVEKD